MYANSNKDKDQVFFLAEHAIKKFSFRVYVDTVLYEIIFKMNGNLDLFLQ